MVRPGRAHVPLALRVRREDEDGDRVVGPREPAPDPSSSSQTTTTRPPAAYAGDATMLATCGPSQRSPSGMFVAFTGSGSCMSSTRFGAMEAELRRLQGIEVGEVDYRRRRTARGVALDVGVVEKWVVANGVVAAVDQVARRPHVLSEVHPREPGCLDLVGEVLRRDGAGAAPEEKVAGRARADAGLGRSLGNRRRCLCVAPRGERHVVGQAGVRDAVVVRPGRVQEDGERLEVRGGPVSWPAPASIATCSPSG